jgi:membrane associated rhomboid family serine protease
MENSSYRKKMLLGQDGNALVELVIINAVMFVLFKFIYIIFRIIPVDVSIYVKNVYHWFVLPAAPDSLLSRPWTLISYMFSDDRVLHVFANLVWLWGFGYIMQDMMGNRKLVPVYIYGGVAGGVFYLLSWQIFHPSIPISSAVLAGANPAVLAIAVATTMVAPDYRIFPMINGGIPLWILTLLYAVIDISGIPYGNTPVYMAHLGGAALGFLFIYQMRRGHDWSEWMNNFFDWFNDLFNPEKKKNTGLKKDQFYYKVSGKEPYKKIPHITQKRIDDILDKINQQGYRFLTDEEKEILKRAADEEEL